MPKEPIAEVVLKCGRHILKVGGFALAMEGDQCRDGSLPEEVLPEIRESELERSHIGVTPAKELPIKVVRFFRGDRWNGGMLQYVCDEINRKAT